ncbi:unnamed protein product [Miscanthus lutarioriparius]|uniref:Uncharacterized protein n=1 Tax=Miscanthus lutarioriparius TaxID=422564 RepID=A0A811QJT1_9POAL|nr:unnamed protein product [Miscanthus lutarioriparius]
MRADGSHSHENDSNEIEKFWVLHLKTLASMLDVLENIIPQMENCKLAANTAENEKTMKGLLGSYYTIVEKLFVILEEIKAGRCVGEIGMPETVGSASRGGSDG